MRFKICDFGNRAGFAKSPPAGRRSNDGGVKLSDDRRKPDPGGQSAPQAWGPEKVGRQGEEGKPRDSKSMILIIERVLQNPRQPRLFWEKEQGRGVRFSDGRRE